ncbi:MAG: hypothetical protein Q7T20_10070 [Saprospiraceae bacterium]|nr:hypothetical protein [Saprospiraceae bacterium]
MSKASRIAFHVYLMLTVFGMTVGVLYFLLMRNDFLTQNPDIEPFLNLYVGAAALTAVGAIALLKSRRWGFWLMVAGLTLAFGIEIMSGFPWDKMLRIPLAGLLLFLLMRWNKMI